MSKKAEKPEPKKDAAEAPKKRSKGKIILLALVPLLLGGAGAGGYFGYTHFIAKPSVGHDAGETAAAEGAHGEAAGDAHAPEGEAAADEAHAEPDPVKVAAVPVNIAAQTSFTHSYALSIMIAKPCGSSDLPALKAASEAEAKADGLLVNLSWTAAARRIGNIDGKTCDYLWAEIVAANAKAEALAGGGPLAGSGGHGGAKPAASGGHH